MNVRDSEFDQLLAEWLEDDPNVAPALPVEAAVDFARIHPRRRDWLAFLRRDAMTTRSSTGLRPVAILAAVIAVLVLAVGGAVLIGSRPDATPSPNASPSGTPVAVRQLPVGTAPLEPGRYTGGLVAPGSAAVGSGPDDEPEEPIDVEFTVGSGWSVGQYPERASCCWYINGEGRSISYWPVIRVYADACDTAGPNGSAHGGRQIGPTVDDFVTAMDEQKYTNMSEPIDVTIGGYPGKRFEMTAGSQVPAYCTTLFLWPDIGGDPGRGIAINGGPGEDTQPVYVIDVEGHRVVFVAWTTGTYPPDAEAVEEVMNSMEFSVR